MFYKKIEYKVKNGFYVPHKRHSDLQIGMQNMDAERVYMYLYNPETGKHEGQWVYPKELLRKENNNGQS